MTEDPYFFYYKMDDDYLIKALSRKRFEIQSYRKWALRAKEEEKYIRNVIKKRGIKIDTF